MIKIESSDGLLFFNKKQLYKLFKSYVFSDYTMYIILLIIICHCTFMSIVPTSLHLQ